MFAGAGVVVLLDQAAKLAVQRYLLPGQSVPVWPGVFHLSYVQNPGAAFGILKYQTGFFVAITALVTAAIVVYARRLGPEAGWLRFALALELGGALGNLIDRLRYGYVVDFLDFRVWPVFNVADMAVVAGVGLIFFYLLRAEGRAA
ncbi:MAG TPA: signal peptidase II [Firmicutes bacterium]|nr:signal peptidase II [Bacillota bacterium]